MAPLQLPQVDLGMAQRQVFGYRLVIPIAAYVSAKGTRIEGSGITTDISIPWSYEDAAAAIDRQLNGAIEALWIDVSALQPGRLGFSMRRDANQ